MSTLRATAFAITLTSLAFSASGQVLDCTGDRVISDPPAFEWAEATDEEGQPYFVGTLEMREADFVIDGQDLTTRAYGQPGRPASIPGPTMFMQPGTRYVLRFHNTLPYESLDPRENVFKDPNVSNIHTHGLHISGESPSDDVTRSFEGGFGGDFVYAIPEDHMGGTYWYHAHHHGSTFLQVSGGAFGLILMDDSNDGIPESVAAMEERQLVVAFLDTAAAGTGGDTLLWSTLPPTWTVNGKVQGDLCMPADTWQRWRVLLADRNAMEKTVSVGPQCEVMLLARDGVWRTTAPKPLANNAISLTGASRADLAVRCSGDSSLNVNGNPVAQVRVAGQPGDDFAGPYDDGEAWSAIRPDYLRDLRGETNVNTERVRMGARTINGSKFDKHVPTFILPATQVQEWSISGANNHPFHLHVYHFQALDCGGDFEDGEFYDVLASNCTVRFDLDELTSSVYEGRTIMHCHILSHEDRGGMGWLDVVGGQDPPTFPEDFSADPPYSEYYAIPVSDDPPTVPGGLSAAVEVGSENIGRGFRKGFAEVTVTDDAGMPVADALVSGFFSGTFDDDVVDAGPTGADGTVRVTTAGEEKGSITVQFCVTTIFHEDYGNFDVMVCAEN